MGLFDKLKKEHPIKKEETGAAGMEFPFNDAPNTAAIICCHVMESEAPILYVSHDENDGMYHMMKTMECGNFCAEKCMEWMRRS